MLKKQLLFALLSLSCLACQGRETPSEQDAAVDSNILKDYINEPLDKAKQLNAISTERDRALREQLGEQ